MNERPLCHRAEDLVSYLYGEAGEADALDFRTHLVRCDACRSEFGIFNQVHESILLWRNEALGASFNPAAVTADPITESSQFVRHQRKLSAVTALREFFSVSPLWLRGATAFAGLLLCVLVVFAISRSWQRPAPVATNESEPKVFTRSEFKAEVARQVKIETDKFQQASGTKPGESAAPQVVENSSPRIEVVGVRKASRPRVRALTLEERQQLAADLRLIPAGDDEELPFAIEEPNP